MAHRRLALPHFGLLIAGENQPPLKPLPQTDLAFVYSAGAFRGLVVDLLKAWREAAWREADGARPTSPFTTQAPEEKLHEVIDFDDCSGALVYRAIKATGVNWAREKTKDVSLAIPRWVNGFLGAVIFSEARTRMYLQNDVIWNLRLDLLAAIRATPGMEAFQFWDGIMQKPDALHEMEEGEATDKGAEVSGEAGGDEEEEGKENSEHAHSLGSQLVAQSYVVEQEEIARKKNKAIINACMTEGYGAIRGEGGKLVMLPTVYAALTTFLKVRHIRLPPRPPWLTLAVVFQEMAVNSDKCRSIRDDPLGNRFITSDAEREAAADMLEIDVPVASDAQLEKYWSVKEANFSQDLRDKIRVSHKKEIVKGKAALVTAKRRQAAERKKETALRKARRTKFQPPVLPSGAEEDSASEKDTDSEGGHDRANEETSRGNGNGNRAKHTVEKGKGKANDHASPVKKRRTAEELDGGKGMPQVPGCISSLNSNDH